MLRDGERHTLRVTIGRLTKDAGGRGPAHTADELGLTVQTLTPQLAEQLGARPGKGWWCPRCSRLHRCAGRYRTRGGDPAGESQAVNSAAEFGKALKESRALQRVLLLVRKGDVQRYVALRW